MILKTPLSRSLKLQLRSLKDLQGSQKDPVRDLEKTSIKVFEDAVKIFEGSLRIFQGS